MNLKDVKGTMFSLLQIIIERKEKLRKIGINKNQGRGENRAVLFRIENF